MTGIGIADPPIAAVVAHGAGPDSVGRLEMTVCGESLLWLLGAVEQLRADGAHDVATDQFGAIVAGMVQLDPLVVREVFRDVLWRAWLAELRQLLGSARQDRGRLSPLLLRLPVLFLPLLDQLGAGRNWMAALPAQLRIGPVGGDTYLLSETGEDLSIELVRDGDGWTVSAFGRRVASLGAGWPGSSLRVAPLGVTSRPTVGHGIDVLDAPSFPEMSAARRSIEATSTASAGEIDHQLADVFALLQAGWPAAMPDVQAFFRGVFPITSGPGHWNSASTDAIPLALQLTIPEVSTPLALGESVVHETAHVKLDLLMTMVPLLDNSSERIHRHPWREDLRPLSGVLMGSHAFLNVLLYYRRMVEAGLGGTEAERELARRQSEVLTALELLSERGRFTDDGLALFEGMIGALGRAASRV
ncbi:MAG TPA: HEXXH motif-containing putative peptide modification protein [Acidimicrobiales bacterium]|jgi:HEXXH motif-containing protein